jgi:hypothetical protein
MRRAVSRHTSLSHPHLLFPLTLCVLEAQSRSFMKQTAEISGWTNGFFSRPAWSG